MAAAHATGVVHGALAPTRSSWPRCPATGGLPQAPGLRRRPPRRGRTVRRARRSARARGARRPCARPTVPARCPARARTRDELGCGATVRVGDVVRGGAGRGARGCAVAAAPGPVQRLWPRRPVVAAAAPAGAPPPSSLTQQLSAEGEKQDVAHAADDDLDENAPAASVGRVATARRSPRRSCSPSARWP